MGLSLNDPTRPDRTDGGGGARVYLSPPHKSVVPPRGPNQSPNTLLINSSTMSCIEDMGLKNRESSRDQNQIQTYFLLFLKRNIF